MVLEPLDALRGRLTRNRKAGTLDELMRLVENDWAALGGVPVRERLVRLRTLGDLAGRAVRKRPSPDELALLVEVLDEAAAHKSFPAGPRKALADARKLLYADLTVVHEVTGVVVVQDGLLIAACADAFPVLDDPLLAMREERAWCGATGGDGRFPVRLQAVRGGPPHWVHPKRSKLLGATAVSRLYVPSGRLAVGTRAGPVLELPVGVRQVTIAGFGLPRGLVVAASEDAIPSVVRELSAIGSLVA